MDEDVADVGDFFADLVFDAVADLVGTLNRHLRVHFHMHVHEVLVTHFADETFFNAIDAGDFAGDEADAVHEDAVGGAVHEFVEGGFQQAPAVPGNDGGGGDGGPVIGGFVTFAADEGNADAEKRGGG